WISILRRRCRQSNMCARHPLRRSLQERVRRGMAQSTATSIHATGLSLLPGRHRSRWVFFLSSSIRIQTSFPGLPPRTVFCPYRLKSFYCPAWLAMSLHRSAQTCRWQSAPSKSISTRSDGSRIFSWKQRKTFLGSPGRTVSNSEPHILNSPNGNSNSRRLQTVASIASAPLKEKSSFCLTPLLSCCYFSLCLSSCFIGQGSVSKVHFRLFQPVTYWQTASNCLQSRQGSPTVSIHRN